MSQYLVVRRLQVRAANALPSPLTCGFPAVTAFMGFGHALQRHFNGGRSEGPLKISGVGIVSHRFEMLDHRAGYARTLQLTANPLNEKGERPSFVEEGRAHLTVSLVLEINELAGGARDLETLQRLIFAKMKLAGGDIVAPPIVELIRDERTSLRRLMPGFALLERRDLMVELMQSGDDALAALHRSQRIEHRCQRNDQGKVIWSSVRHQPGWIVPLATGFHALGTSQPTGNSRDPATPHRFAESVVTLGEFVIASRLSALSQMIWRYQHDGDWYLAVQESAAPAPTTEV